MKKIPLSQGKFAIVDDSDFLELSEFNWYYSDPGYARRSAKNDCNRKIYMHRQIMKVRKGVEIDHKNGNKVDNRKSNLRKCNHGQNTRNQGFNRRNESGFKGVRKHRKKWQAVIRLNYKTYCLGTYATKEKAAAIYDKAALKFHKAFARTNAML